MRFWEASALVPLIVEEPGSSTSRSLLATDADAIVWWGAPVECTSSIARREREGTPLDVIQLLETRLRALAARWIEVPPTEAVRTDAMRLLRLHALRTGDALQLAAARAACSGAPGGLAFVCSDRRLATAASREGFHVIDPVAAE